MRSPIRSLVVASCLCAIVSGCSLSYQELRQYKSHTLYTCCNLHYETGYINDANYYEGSLLPLGTPIRITGAGRRLVTFKVGDARMVLGQEYGRGQESFREYLDKVFVRDNPRDRLATLPVPIQKAIIESRVERGMTREQVLMSLGYPPTHQTPSIAANEWTYWSSRFVTYKVVFDGRTGLKSDRRRRADGA